ncbi:stress-activated map kinase interacting protein 1-domain-containing protein [Geopyxis carbonaria]|nr:stress-activated map kinase interacting protein 1-domain-containing protein [Geopyxis carbonaria]
MSLLQNQDFIIHRIRSRYLSSMRDGVGERLITLNPGALNLPAYRNAGWGLPQDIKRTYSPPIPTGEYFASTNTNGGVALEEVAVGREVGREVEREREREKEVEREKEKEERQRRREREEEDDSSDLSEDSEGEEEDAQSAEKQIDKIRFDFTKKEVPHRPRAGSSPIRNGPQVLVTSPSSSKNRTRRLRGGSHGDVDFKMPGGEHEVVPGADEQLLSSGLVAQHEKLHAEIASKLRSSPNSSLPRASAMSNDAGTGGGGYDSGDESDASSTMSSDFVITADSGPEVRLASAAVARTSPAVLNALPPPIRPVSQVQPVSQLTRLLKAKETEAESPMDAYRFFAGKGELTPVYLKIFIPFCRDAGPFEIIVNRVAKGEDGAKNRETTVAEAIGYTLYRYMEDKKEPPLKPEQYDINRWTFRMVDDGEPDDDFPPLERLQPVTSYMTKKMPRGRLGGGAREVKVEGEFALVEATEQQYQENCRTTPGAAARKPSLPSAPLLPTASAPAVPAPRQILADVTAPTTTSTPRTGPSKILRIHTASIDQFAQSISVCVTTDTYIAEVLDTVCRKKALDHRKHLFRVTDAAGTIAPLDRTVASLGDRAELDLVRRHPAAPAASPPAAASPAAPLLLTTARTPKKPKFLQPATALWAPDLAGSRDYLKFTVWRKASMGFMARHERILAIDGEYVHVMPSDQKTLLNAFESQAKTRSIHISTIIGCKTYRKAPASFKILVMRPQKETKRYDFEAASEEVAMEVVAALRRATVGFRMDHEGGV